MSQEALAAMVGVSMDDLTSLLNGGEILPPGNYL
jgi:hypothetical protein